MSACSTLASSAGSTPDASGDDLAALVRFGAYLQTADRAELERQHAQLLNDYQAAPSSSAAIKLSLVLSYQQTDPEALAEALAVLAETCNGDDEEAELGRVIYHLVNQRYLATTDNDSISARLVEEHTRNARLNRELAEAKVTLAAAEQQRAELAQQLDALKAIEEQINFDAVATGGN